MATQSQMVSGGVVPNDDLSAPDGLDEASPPQDESKGTISWPVTVGEYNKKREKRCFVQPQPVDTQNNTDPVNMITKDFGFTINWVLGTNRVKNAGEVPVFPPVLTKIV